MQNLNFSSIEEFLEFLPVHERKIVDVLRRLIKETIPELTEKLSYNVPFYYYHSRVCYIWPSSVPWGKVAANGVLLGFCHGSLLKEQSDYFDRKDRKMMATKTFHSISETDPDLIRSFLFEAFDIDHQLFMEKQRKKREKFGED